MNVVQSYLTTIMRGDFTLYETRIFMKIVELANQTLKGAKASSYLRKVVCTDGINCNLVIPVRDIMTENSQAYNRVREALEHLMHKEVKLYIPELKEWRATTLLNNIRMTEHDGLIKFVVPKWLLEYIMNFIEGNFSLYDLQVAITLPSAYAVRLYWLTCSMKDTTDFSIIMLKSMLGADEKYKQTKDFIRRCIEPAQKALATRNVNGFTYTKVFKGNKVTALRFKPVKRQKIEPSQLVAQASLSAWCHPLLRQYLTQQCGFKLSELRPHKDLLMKFGNVPDWQTQIVKITNRARKTRKGKGYIINGMRLAVKESSDKLPLTAKRGQSK